MTTLIVETGSGLPNANSYVLLAEAEAYISDMPSSATASWYALDDNARSALLIYATRVLDQRGRWNGEKQVTASALRWPRRYMFDCDRLPVAVNTVPRNVKAAVCEMALWFSVDGRNPLAVSDTQGLKSLKADVVDIVWKDNYDPTGVLALPRGLNQLLCGLGTIVYGTGSSFGPINRV